MFYDTFHLVESLVWSLLDELQIIIHIVNFVFVLLEWLVKGMFANFVDFYFV